MYQYHVSISVQCINIINESYIPISIIALISGVIMMYHKINVIIKISMYDE